MLLKNIGFIINVNMGKTVNFGHWFRGFFRQRYSQYGFVNINGGFEHCEKFNSAFPVLWAMSMYEIFNPIDMIAEKASSIPYILIDDNGRDVEPNGFLKKILKKPNEIYSFSQLLYSYTFNLCSHGNAFIHTVKLGENLTYANVLNSDLTFPVVSGKDALMLSKNNNIEGYLFKEFKVPAKDVYYSVYLPHTFDNLQKLGQSPLLTVEKNINLLAAVYMARWNVYDNNGIAGILTKKATNENAFEMALDPITQKSMADELMKEYKITGHNNIKGISSIPMEFLKTLATISELEPYREVQADSIAIASIYGIKKELLGRESDTTFNNQRDAERFLWQNTIKPICYDICEMLEGITGTNYHFIPDFSKIEVLQDDESIRTDIISKKIEAFKNVKEITGQNTDEKIIMLSEKI